MLLSGITFVILDGLINGLNGPICLGCLKSFDGMFPKTSCFLNQNSAKNIITLFLSFEVFVGGCRLPISFVCYTLKL